MFKDVNGTTIEHEDVADECKIFFCGKYYGKTKSRFGSSAHAISTIMKELPVAVTMATCYYELEAAKWTTVVEVL